MKTTKTGMKNAICILLVFCARLTFIAAQDVIALQNVTFDNSATTINEIRSQQQFQQKIIENMFDVMSFGYVHVLPTGFPGADIPKNADRIEFVTVVGVKEMYVFIRRWFDGWYCEFALIFTNSSKLEGLADTEHYSCKSAEDAKKFCGN